MTPLREVPAKNYLQAFVLFFVLMSLAFSTRWLSGHKFLFEILWDPIPNQFLYPADQLESQALRHGKIGLWDPSRGFGSPLMVPSGATLTQPLKLLGFFWGTDNGQEAVLLLRLVFAGFFLYLLGRGMDLSHPAGLLAGIGFMFTGYFREFINHQDLNVVMFYPVGLLFLLRFFVFYRMFDFLLLMGAGYFCFGGGHPESIYYLIGLLLTSAAYGMGVRVIAYRKKSGPSLFRAAFFSFLIIIYSHLSHYILFPFWELILRGWIYHPAGMGKLHFDFRHFIALLTPIFDFWLELPTKLTGNLAQFTVIPAYLGFILGSLALLSLFGLTRLNRMAGYFWGLALSVAGIVFGAPGFELLTSIPGVDRMQNFRYLQPILALAVAVLAGYGFDLLKDSRMRRVYLGIIAGMTAWLLFHMVAFRAYLLASPLFLAAAILLVLFLAGLLVYYFVARNPRIFSIEFRAIIFAATAIELFAYFVFIAPFYGTQAFQISKPAFLDQAKMEPEFYRFYSPDQKILPPNTASLFGLRDVRERVPLYSRDYYLFISAVNNWRDEKEAMDEFLTDGKFYLPLELNRMTAAAQNMLFGYLITPHPLGSADLTESLSRGALTAPAKNYFSYNLYEMAGKSRRALLVHPPAKFVPDEKVNPGEFAFKLGLSKKTVMQSDGAQFLLTGSDAGEKRLLFARYLKYEESQENGWIDYSIYLNSSLNLDFATLPDPKGDNIQDYALFADLHTPDRKGDNSYQLLSDAGPYLYRRAAPAPRFFLASKLEWAASKEDALKQLRAGRLSRDFTTLVSEAAPDLNALKSVYENPAGKINLLRDEPGQVELELKLASPAVLVMLDSFLPGWQVFVDGKEQRIYRADYLFRGVVAPAGVHQVKFIYRPLTFELGVWHNAAFFIAWGLIAFLLLVRWRLGRPAFPAPPAPG